MIFSLRYIVYNRTPTERQNPRPFGILGGCGLGQRPLHVPEEVHGLYCDAVIDDVVVAAGLVDGLCVSRFGEGELILPTSGLRKPITATRAATI